jgi:antibiotic biosynthesis monooxygenase
MFAVIYLFDVKPNQEEKFEKSWSDLTKLIYKFEKGLGSRLHRQNERKYIAYAQWPNKSTWLNSGENLPDESKVIRQIMRDSCEKIETLYELEVVNDLLIKV